MFYFPDFHSMVYWIEHLNDYTTVFVDVHTNMPVGYFLQPSEYLRDAISYLF